MCSDTWSCNENKLHMHWMEEGKKKKLNSQLHAALNVASFAFIPIQSDSVYVDQESAYGWWKGKNVQ